MNTAPKLPQEVLARNVRNALGPYNDDDLPLIGLIVHLRNKLALAPPSGEGCRCQPYDELGIHDFRCPLSGEGVDKFAPHWPEGVEYNTAYELPCDDKGRNGASWLRVVIANDGDVHLVMQDWEDFPNGEPNPIPSLRCRTYFGGGRNNRTHQAMLNLAQAIMLDTGKKEATTPPPASQERGGDFPVMRSAFVTSESCGPDNDYRLVFRFRSLEALQQAHREWVGAASPPSSAAEGNVSGGSVAQSVEHVKEAPLTGRTPGCRVATGRGFDSRQSPPIDAAEQAKLVAINPVEIDSKLIPDAAEQAKPDGPPVFFIRQDGTHGEYPPPDECSCPQHGGWVTAKRRAEQAEAKLALAEQDARRLDALEGIFHREGTAGGYSRVSGGIDISIEIGGREFVGDTLRAAIDASQD